MYKRQVYKDAGTAERTQDNMEVRLDAKVTNEKETRALGIEVGDFISFDPRTVVTETGFIKSRHLDDKVSAAILLNLLRIYKEEKIELPVTTHFAFSVFEEVGHGLSLIHILVKKILLFTVPNGNPSFSAISR